MGDMAVSIAKPELPQAERMNPIERLNIEKNLIGIFLSSHPLDEYKFEVEKLCNVRASELQQFDGWRTPEVRKATENMAAEGEEMEENALKPTEWIEKHENQPMHIGGIITSAEEAVSQKGNPYGRYIIEDYSGSYKMTLFGQTYAQCSPMLKPNMYVYITGTIQQRGTGRQWFKPKPTAEAEYEFVVQTVELLKDVQDKRVQYLVLRMPLHRLNSELTEMLTEEIEKHKGKTRLQIVITDGGQETSFVSQKYTVRVDKDFYKWLQEQEEEGTMEVRIK
jgi:DNA polymerase-3 subunit alpha